MCAGWSEERLSSLFDAVADLRRSLKSIGSTLVVRKGRSKDVLLALAEEVSEETVVALGACGESSRVGDSQFGLFPFFSTSSM